MINVLIVEDNPEKLKKIVEFLEGDCNLNPQQIKVADTCRTGRQFLVDEQFDLLLLDLVLPFNDGDEALPESGNRFLDEIYYNPNINIPIHIIGLTEFESVFEDYHKTFDDKLWSLINFNISHTDWVDKLKSKVFYLQNQKLNFQAQIKNQRKFDVAIVTALNMEFEQLMSLRNWERYFVEDDPLVYYSSTLNTKNSNNLKIIICCVNQMGMQAMASVSSKIAALFNPANLFVVGICAGIKSSGIGIGDIAVATQCWDYENGKIVEIDNELTFKPNMVCIPTHHGNLASLISFSNHQNYLFPIYNDFTGDKPQTQLQVKYGSVGSGPYVLSSKKYLSDLLEKDRKLIAIDMEGCGVYIAAQYHPNVHPLFIKSVSDFGDEHKHDNYQKYAAYTSARFTLEYLYHSK